MARSLPVPRSDVIDAAHIWMSRRHRRGDGQWEAWSEPPAEVYGRGLKGTQWDRTAIGVTTDGHMWYAAARSVVLLLQTNGPVLTRRAATGR
eukprot:COSAG02_NODE_689_length_18462_cov_36.417470_9_plen_92_part_00